MTQTTTDQAETPKERKVGFTAEEKKEMAKFCAIDVYDESTLFFNITYNGNRIGRTCFILGAFGLHARVKGNQKGMVHNENMGLNELKEVDFDLTVSVLRPQVTGVTIQRVTPDYMSGKKKEDMTTDELIDLADKPEYVWNVIVSYGSSSYLTIQGLREEDAIMHKKIVWLWMNYGNQIDS
jgi:hypothetical protein